MITSAMGHTFRTDTFLQVVFDFGFVFVGILIAVMWVGNELPIDIRIWWLHTQRSSP